MKILTVISNYNEEKSIEKCIEDFRENAAICADLLVIDNCSTDSSIKVIKETKVDYLQHAVNTGGSAGVIKTALLYAFKNDYDIYCHMDGDDQHNAAELEELVKPIMKGNADIVIGSRFLNKEGFQSYFARRLGIHLFSRLLSIITGQKLTDITSGFRAYNKKAISLFAKNFKHELEACIQLLMIAAYAGLSIKEVSIIMKSRNTGKSEIGVINSIKFPAYGIISIVGTMIQKKAIRGLTDADLR